MAAWQHRLMVEDGFIYLRVAKQIVAGHGPVFNPGQRVEATTGALWVYLLAAADFVAPMRLEWIAVVLGMVLSTGGLVFALLGARRLWPTGRDQLLFIPFGAIAYAVLLPSWAFATTGLETSLCIAWLGACLWVLALQTDPSRERPVSIGAAALLGLGWLVRPELVLFSAGFLAVLLFSAPRPTSLRRRCQLVAAFIALPLAYQVFRMGYYGSLVPNTAIAKDGASGSAERGWRYFQDFVDPYWLWVPMLTLAIAGYLPLMRAARRWGQVHAIVAVFVVGALVNIAYIVWVGGDHTHARLLLPAYFALCAPVAAIPWTRVHAVGLVLIPWALLAVVTLRPDQYRTSSSLAHGVLMWPKQWFGRVTTQDSGWPPNGPPAWYVGPAYYRAGDFFRAGIATRIPLARNTRLPLGAFYGVGITGYAMGPSFRILDLEGLADPFTAHLISTLPPLTTFPGHAKPLPAQWLAARVTRPGSHPYPRDFPPFGRSLIRRTTGRTFQEQVLWARAALACPSIRQLQTASESDLTLARFTSNFFESFENTRLRIPPDPVVAYHRFCGSGMPNAVREFRRAETARRGRGSP